MPLEKSGRRDEGQAREHEKHVSVLWDRREPGHALPGSREEGGRFRQWGQTELKRAEAGS